MQLAMIGLGRMGASMVRRLMANGRECVVHDTQAAPVVALQKEGASASWRPAAADALIAGGGGWRNTLQEKS